jgi:hypothetical protein
LNTASRHRHVIELELFRRFVFISRRSLCSLEIKLFLKWKGAGGFTAKFLVWEFWSQRWYNDIRWFVNKPRFIIQDGARKTGPPSRKPTWAQVSDSVQEIKQMQMQSTYWLEKVQKMISLYVNVLLCTLQHIVMHAMQLSGVSTPFHRVCSTYDNMLQRAQSTLTYKEIIFCTFSNQ